MFAVWPSAESNDLPRQLIVHGAKELYDAACAACHGMHGEGDEKSTAGLDPPSALLDFSKCADSTPDHTRDYKAVIRKGGPARGFSTIMPSFSGVLTSQQMNEVVAQLRSSCKQPGWPYGELNVPRALLTEKNIHR